MLGVCFLLPPYHISHTTHLASHITHNTKRNAWDLKLLIKFIHQKIWVGGRVIKIRGGGGDKNTQFCKGNFIPVLVYRILYVDAPHYSPFHSSNKDSMKTMGLSFLTSSFSCLFWITSPCLFTFDTSSDSLKCCFATCFRNFMNYDCFTLDSLQAGPSYFVSMC